MGHMGNGAHGPWGPWAMGPMGDWDIFAYSIINTGWIHLPIPLYPIAHVTHCRCGPYPLYPIPPVPLLPMCPIPPVPHCPMAIWVMGAMGYRGYRPMGDWDIFAHSIINTGWILTKILLDTDINVFYLNTGRFLHDGFI